MGKEQVRIGMTSSGDNKNIGNVEIDNKHNKKAVKVIKLTVIIVLIIIAGFTAKNMLKPKSSGSMAGAPAQQVPMVMVDSVIETDLAVEREYIGSVEAIQSVSIKPQVSGEITRVYFKEGSVVRAGQLLFSIDAARYQATVDLRKAEVDKADANFERASKYFDRLKAADKRSVSESDIELAESNLLQGKAAVAQAKAALKLAQIELSYTRITAPITGRIGAAAYTKGNLVSPASGTLATIEQTDPIRVAFAMPDRDYLNQMAVFKENGKSVYQTTLKLANGNVLPVEGVRDFEDNKIDEKTGTLMMYLRYANSSGLLIPGSMVRIGTKPVKSERVKVIPQISVLADSEGDYVYSVGKDNIVQQRRITLGAEHGSMREVKTGLNIGESIITQGLQGVRPGMTVKTETASTGGAKSAAEIVMESEEEPNGTASSSSDLPKPASKDPKTGEN